jgi:hypothetical protein
VETLAAKVRTDADDAMNAGIPKITALGASGVEPASPGHPGVAAPESPDDREDGLEEESATEEEPSSS